MLVVDSQLSTLLDVSLKQHYRADRGRHGEGNNKTGRSGADLELRVPPGTLVRDRDSGELLGELLSDGERLVCARGGRGGRGNARFRSSTRQAPRHWEPGEEGQERVIELELKLIADVGLVGEPNAGKSTFLASVSSARPKVADYPFTTLAPNLGVVSLPDFRSFVVADIPGIIEGAHTGKGLGLQFLRHIERTRTLVFMVPADMDDPQGQYDLLRREVEQHSSALASKPHCVVVTKSDLLPPDEASPAIRAPGAWGCFTISSVSRAGLPELLEGLWRQADEARRVERLQESQEGGEGQDPW